jgi:hypothetical protein
MDTENSETISVFVADCNEDGSNPFTHLMKNFTDVDKACEFAIGKLGKRKCIILRPNANEHDENGKRFFREWRSVNGEDLKEFRWYG